MKLTISTISTIAAMLVGTTAFANVADPRAELFRANGCAAEYLRPVTNAAGEVLYWTNTEGKGCPVSTGGPSVEVVEYGPDYVGGNRFEEEEETDEVIDASY